MSRPAEAVVLELRKRYRLDIGGGAALAGGYDVWAQSWRLESDHGPVVVRADHRLSPETAGWLSDVQRRVAERGVPCCQPLCAHDGSVAFRAGGATITVREFAEGAELDRDDPAQVSAAGATLGLLHRAGLDMEVERPAPSPWDASFWPGTDDPPALHDQELDCWDEAFTGDGGRGFARGLVHGDFWSDNIIWSAGHVAAVIDWSEARLDLLARELAWATWEFGHDGAYELDVERARTFLGGYREVCGPWEHGLADVFIVLMRVQLRLNARYSLADAGDVAYNTSLQREFVRLRHQPATPLLDP